MYVRPQVELLTSIAEGIYAASGDLYGIDEPIDDGSLSSRSGSGHAEKMSEENFGEGARICDERYRFFGNVEAAV